nr:hypothetical protein [Candidatus Sigynarchaeota archaeon]
MKLTTIGITTLLACTFGCAGSLLFYVGFILKRIDSSGYYGLVGFGLLFPIIMMLVANLKERVKKYVLFINAALAIIGSYFVILGAPNFTVPDFRLDTVPLYMYYLTLGAHFTLFEIGIAEVLRQARETGFLWLGAGLGVGSVIVALVIMSGVNGWLYMIMVINYIIPSAMLVYFLVYPEGAAGEKTMFTPQSREVVGKFLVRDGNAKGWKLTLYTIIVAFGSIATLGINSMTMPRADYFSISWLFWLLTGAGAFVAALVAKVLFQKIHGMESCTEKDRKAQLPWMLIAIAQSVGLLAVTLLEIYAPGYHLSILAHIFDGLVFGFNLGAYFAILAVQHPPKSNYAYYMTLGFFIIFSLAAANYLKTVVNDMNDITDYALYILGALVIVVALLVIMQLITIKQKGRAPAKPTQVATQAVSTPKA